ncbi:TolB family protein [Acidicapsa ligni]|uniref:TolB family protein n=1 Tax=Acidicapsa ligni TaxID=542300 RepID=UPI0021DF4B5A|nr:hypothetical protein [Acidicapsa ligni]
MNRKLPASLLAWVSCALILCAMATRARSQSAPTSLGVFDGHNDVGTVLHAGTVDFDSAKGAYTITGSGENMWLTKDAFHFLWKKTSGDVSLTADIHFPSAGTNPHRKAVLVIRQNLDADSVYVDAALHGSGLTALQYRSAIGDETHDIEWNISAPQRLRIDKRGDTITMYMSTNGEPLHPAGAAVKLHLEGEFYIGLGVCSHDKNVIEKAVFSNVQLKPIAPAIADAKPILYSTLRTIATNPESPIQTNVFTAQGLFAAPNWTRDGKSLLFDQSGKIMSIPVDGGTPHALDTGIATNCGSSHGLSPDGKWLAATCFVAGDPGARIYIFPSGGGAARLVTKNPASWWHGWSPDGKTLAFVRPGSDGLNIDTISVDGGEESAATTGAGIHDDPDYSPDGQYIYFNSNRGGGTMQIWRMHPDGSQPEQVTSDERNNWTPHISPDDKWMVFVSYDKSVTGHLPNKDIQLRLMSLGDKKIRTLVDIVGGAGTINVPSWAPDSSHLAFVSFELVPADAK